MARFYSLKKKDEDNDKIADPFNVLRPKIKEKEKPTIKIHDMAKVYEFLANGFEDIEALGPVDVLRRGGLDVKTVSISGDLMVASAQARASWLVLSVPDRWCWVISACCVARKPHAIPALRANSMAPNTPLPPSPLTAMSLQARVQVPHLPMPTHCSASLRANEWWRR